MVGINSPAPKSASLSRLHSVSPSQATARKLVRKYSLTSNRLLVNQRRELTALRTSLPNLKAASDLEVVLAAIAYIEKLQSKVVFLSRLSANTTTAGGPEVEGHRSGGDNNSRREEIIDNKKTNTETNNN
jgi:hypothetical protein